MGKNINTLGQHHTTEEIIERVEQYSSKSIIRAILPSIRGSDESGDPYKRIYHVYFPIFVTNVDIEFSKKKKIERRRTNLYLALTELPEA